MKLNFTLLIETLRGEVLRLHRMSHHTPLDSEGYNKIILQIGLLREQVEALQALENLTKPTQLH
jgi:hypothetical protein